MQEIFSNEDIDHAIKQFLEYGEESFGKSHKGYFSGEGWAARCLRFHLAERKASQQEAP